MRYFGFKKETTFGTAETTPTLFMDLAKDTLDPPSNPMIELPSIEETSRRGKKGFYSPSGDIEYAMDLITIPHFLYFALGGYNYTAGDSEDDELNTHEIWPDSGRALPSFTTFLGKDNGGTNGFEHIFAGCIINKFNLDISDGLAIAKFNVVAKKDSQGNLRDNVTVEDTYPLAFYEATAKNNNVDVSAITKSFGLELDNKIKAEDGQAFGSMHPYTLLSTGKGINIKTDTEFQGATHLKRFWGGNTEPTKNTEYFDYQLDFVDELGNTLCAYFPKLCFTTVSTPVEGSDLIKQSLEMQVFKDTVELADGTEVQTSCLFTIKNNKASVA